MILIVMMMMMIMNMNYDDDDGDRGLTCQLRMLLQGEDGRQCQPGFATPAKLDTDFQIVMMHHDYQLTCWSGGMRMTVLMPPWLPEKSHTSCTCELSINF